MAKRQVGRKKIWISIVAPKIFKEVEVGETSAYDPNDIIGRKLWVYYPQVSGDVTKHYIKLQFKIVSVKGDKALTKISGYEITRPYLARAIRRRKSKVDLIKDIKCKDEKIRIKIVALTSSKANAKQRTEIRKRMEEILEKEVPKYDLENLILEIINKKLQNSIESGIKKIFPIAFLEVRKIEVE